ncbi:MAG: DUF2277 family protein [Actinomycetes bacterium]
MCRSIKTLRPPYVDEATEADARAAALQYVRKISGFRAPSRANAAAFEAAVEEITAVTVRLLGDLSVPAPRDRKDASAYPTPKGGQADA